jgi:serine protease Do
MSALRPARSPAPSPARCPAPHARARPLHALLALVVAASAVAVAPTAAALPPLPGPAGPGAPPSAPATPAAPASSPAEHARRGVVAVEVAGKPVAIGTVLANDGRILTSLSGLGATETVQVRYADGSTVAAKVGHKDVDWDLALLVPQAIKWKEGLAASDIEPNATDLRLVLPLRGKLGAIPVALKGRTDAKSRGGAPLLNTLDLDMKGALSVPGAPVLDSRGNAVGLLVHACQVRSTARCAPVSVGAPISAIRTFLMRTPATAVAPQPWLGLRGAPSQAGSIKGVRVLALAPQSPAERAGLKASAEPDGGDIIVAVDGAPVETPEQLADAIGRKAIGDTAKLLVFDGTKFREAPVTLRPAP